jgi:CheY-like chemotaxis protein
MSSYPAVLYVEDDAKSCKVMRVMLVNQMGLSNVTIFEDSTDFLPRVAQLDPLPDIVFLDIHLKPYNGFEMLDMLRDHDHYQRIPIVALTASVMSEEVHRLRVSGFNGCIAKPISLERFPEILERFLTGEEIWQIVS